MKNAFEFQATKILKKSNKKDKMHLLASMIIISRNNMQSLACYITLSVSNTQKDKPSHFSMTIYSYYLIARNTLISI